ncbi:unnamed protein product [Oppiella nova]|uniref:C2H2-type domain-containing protein n=1 Tax=Oppiella nova TaxID=334625 RepID=A0A7R9QM81_9ACAR|nr:unnamed protein product [Oppiella nova]CAG2168663.1 unnamed protein product [Oppiella nova]
MDRQSSMDTVLMEGLTTRMKSRVIVKIMEAMDTKLFKCGLNGCQFTTKFKRSLIRHTTRCKGIDSNRGGQGSDSHSSRSGPVMCGLNGCQQKVFHKKELSRHRLRLHPDAFPDIPWLECSYTDCHYKTKSKDSMKTHELSHSKPFVCDECGHTFSTAQSLGIHLPNHDPSLRHRCQWPACDLSFTSKYTLDLHMNSHTRETIYRCHWPGCEKEFIRSDYLKDHEKRHNGRIGRFVCHWPECEYRCEKGPSLKRHMFRTHKVVTEVSMSSQSVSKRVANECNLIDRRAKRPKK